jgi:hypothetical protein
MAYDSGRVATVMLGGSSFNETWELETAPGAKLSISRTQGSFNDPITITGTGFAPSDRVTVYNDAPTSSPIYAAFTDSTGRFVITGHVAAQPYGSHRLIAIGQTSRNFGRTAFFMQASLELRPTEGIPDQTIGVTGQGYGAGDTVNLHWSTPTGPILRQDVTDSRGTLYSFFIVPPGAKPGQHLVYVTGIQTRARAIAIFTVR